MVQAGNSGEPLLDGSGNVIGVVSSKLNAMKVILVSNDLPTTMNFAIKAPVVAIFLVSNRVAYTNSTADAALLPLADIVDQARAISAL